MSSSDGYRSSVPLSDPFSDPDVYYGEEEIRKGKHRRAFSAVSDYRSSVADIVFDSSS